MTRRAAPFPALDDPEQFGGLSRAAGLPPDVLAARIAAAAARGLRFRPEALRLGRSVNHGHTDAVVAELHADGFPYIVKIRAGRSLSAERRSVAGACADVSVELRRFLLPPIHVETLARRKTLPGGALEFALYEHARAAHGAQSGLASWREALLHSPRLLPESARALARVWRTESAGLAVKRVPLASSALYRDKLDKLARASAPPEQPGGARVPLDRYLREGPASALVPDWLRGGKDRRDMIRRVLSCGGGKPLAPVARGFMHGDLHGDNILLHFAGDAPSGFSVIDLGSAAAKGCALYDWAKLCVSLVEAQYSTPAYMALPHSRAAARAADWSGELARRLLGNTPGKKRRRPGEEAALAAALHLRHGLAPDAATGTDLVRALFLNAFFALRYVSFRNTAWNDPSVVRNTVLHAAAADAFARAISHDLKS